VTGLLEATTFMRRTIFSFFLPAKQVYPPENLHQVNIGKREGLLDHYVKD